MLRKSGRWRFSGREGGGFRYWWSWRGGYRLSGLRIKGGGPGHVEDMIHAIAQELVFVVGNIAIDIQFFELLGDSPGADIVIFSEYEGFTAQAADGVKEAGIVDWVGIELTV